MTNTSSNAISLNNNILVARALTKAFPNTVAHVSPLSLIIRTTPSRLRVLAAFVAKSTTIRASTLVDIAVTDRLGARGRFSVKYLFLSSLYNNRVTLEIYVDETTAVPSLASPFFNCKRIFASAG